MSFPSTGKIHKFSNSSLFFLGQKWTKFSNNEDVWRTAPGLFEDDVDVAGVRDQLADKQFAFVDHEEIIDAAFDIKDGLHEG